MGYLGQKCGNIVRMKNELEHKLSYYRNHTSYKRIKNEFVNLDMRPCRDFYKYKNFIR